MTPAQVLAARKLLRWSRYRLAAQADLPPCAVEEFERYGAGRSASSERIAAIRTALETAGVTFIDGEEPGAKLRSPAPLTPFQVRAARVLLGWTRPRMAQASGVPEAAIADFERGAVSPAMSSERLAVLRAALESAGVTFAAGEPDLRMRRGKR